MLRCGNRNTGDLINSSDLVGSFGERQKKTVGSNPVQDRMLPEFREPELRDQKENSGIEFMFPV